MRGRLIAEQWTQQLTKALRGRIQRWGCRPLPIAACLAKVQFEVLLKQVLVNVICVVFWRLWQQAHLLLYGLVFHCSGGTDIWPLL